VILKTKKVVSFVKIVIYPLLNRIILRIILTSKEEEKEETKKREIKTSLLNLSQKYSI